MVSVYGQEKSEDSAALAPGDLFPLGGMSKEIPIYIEDTFTDTDFKTMARLTGGRYYHANNAEEVYSILQKIFSRP